MPEEHRWAAQLVIWVALLAIKHVVADFTLQPSGMAIAKDRGSGWLRPLLLHCAAHGTLTTLLVVGLADARFWFLGPIDFIVHFGIDRAKGVVSRRYALTQNDRPFWIVLGVDQALHHVTGFCLALTVVIR